MPACSFCGHESHDGARTCVACGNVLAPAETGAPTPSPEPRTGPTPAEPGREEVGGGGTIAGLFDPEQLRKAARQAEILLVLAAVVALVSAVSVILDLGDVLDALDPAGFSVGSVEMDGRFDRLTLAELSLAAGALVMLGGWAQQAAANGALPGVGRPDRSSTQVLFAFVIPGLNAWRAGPVMAELWRDATPPGAPREPGGLTGAFSIVFGIGISARIAVAIWAMVAFPTISSAGTAWWAAALLVSARLAWIGALATTVVMIRALTARRLEQAGRLDV